MQSKKIAEFNAKKYWNNIYNKKGFNEVSWYQKKPQTSLNLIAETGLDKDSAIIDVGCGDSNLIDNLLDLGFNNLSVLDISSTALEKAQKRLGERARTIKWICSDVKKFKGRGKFDIWHDRALFHFLTSKEDINKYVNIVRENLRLGGYLIIGTFSDKGPKECSGLECKQYSEEVMKRVFHDFKHVKSIEEIHHTPFKTTQSFIYNFFRR